MEGADVSEPAPASGPGERRGVGIPVSERAAERGGARLPARERSRPALLDEALGFGGPIIVFDDVYLAFDDKVILRGVSFTLQTGHTKVFLGASGAGKSTILRLALGLLLSRALNPG